MLRVLMQKISARLNRLEIKGRSEIPVLDRLRLGELSSSCVSASRVIEELPSAERRAHR